jgi:hypothetical protein
MAHWDVVIDANAERYLAKMQTARSDLQSVWKGLKGRCAAVQQGSVAAPLPNEVAVCQAYHDLFVAIISGETRTKMTERVAHPPVSASDPGTQPRTPAVSPFRRSGASGRYY